MTNINRGDTVFHYQNFKIKNWDFYITKNEIKVKSIRYNILKEIRKFHFQLSSPFSCICNRVTAFLIKSSNFTPISSNLLNFRQRLEASSEHLPHQGPVIFRGLPVATTAAVTALSSGNGGKTNAVRSRGCLDLVLIFTSNSMKSRSHALSIRSFSN